MTFEQPVPPIIAMCDDPSVSVFATADLAASYMEPQDVADGEWTAWDSLGHRLTVDTADAMQGPVEIWWDPQTSGSPEPEVVAALLRDDMRAVTRHPLEIADLDSATLPELIAEAQRLDTLPGPFARWMRRLLGRRRTE